MTKDELKLAFQKAFQMGQDYWYYANHEFESYNKKSDAIRAKFNEMVKETIEEALAQPEQEPVAWDNCRAERMCRSWCGNSACASHYADTTTPQREFVGLTDEEKHAIRYSHMTSAEFIEVIEAKLKEKNKCT